MSVNPYSSPKHPSDAAPRSWRPRLFSVFLVLCAFVLLVGLLLPFSRNGTRSTARRLACSNNLKMIGLALNEYAKEHGELPPAYTVDENGTPLHSWRTLILPYLGLNELYDSIDLEKPWDDPDNNKARTTIVSPYSCPGWSSRPSDYQTSYFAIVGNDACFNPSRPRKLDEITDGAANTLMIVEAPTDHAVHWMCPKDANEALILELSSKSQLIHSPVWHGVMVDGYSVSLSDRVSAKTRRAMITVNAGDVVAAE